MWFLEVGLPLLLFRQMVFPSPEFARFNTPPPPHPTLCHLTHTHTHDRPAGPLFHPPDAFTLTVERCRRVWRTDGGLAGALSVRRVCLTYNQLTWSPMSSSVANSAPVPGHTPKQTTSEGVCVCPHIVHQNSRSTSKVG